MWDASASLPIWMGNALAKLMAFQKPCQALQANLLTEAYFETFDL
jgi:hypothetical protein